jgi:hypothetical protein
MLSNAKQTYILPLHMNGCLLLPATQAVKIALETKKHLVDNNMHDVTQVGAAVDDLASVLHNILQQTAAGSPSST